MTRKQTRLITLLSLVILVLGIGISRRVWFRLDLTRDKANTISAVSRELYTEIAGEVSITYYLSDKLAQVHPLPGEIRDFLGEYAAYSRGRIRFILRDPAKAGLVEAVEQLGIQAQQVQTVEQDQASFATVYTGIVIEYLDKVEVLPVVFSLDTLEYDITSRIRSLVREQEREVAVLVGDSYRKWEGDYDFLNQAFIRSGFRVRNINAGEEIPDTVPVLFVLGGTEDLDDWALYRIDRYIQGGGRVLFALDGVFVDSQAGLEARVMTDKGLLSMVSFYGATVKPALVLDQSALTLQYQTTSPSGATQLRISRYPHWIGVLGENGNPGHPVSSGFAGVDLFWPSPIELNPPEPVKAEPLFSSTPDAWLMTGNFVTNPDPQSRFDREAPDTRGTKLLAAALSGKFPSWFEGVPKPVREGSSEELPDRIGETRDSRIIVIGDTDFASVFMQYTQAQRNLDFLLQAADWLGNDDDIIGIRNRQGQTGRLDRILDPEKRERAMLFSRILNVVIVPLGVILLGIFFAWRRRREMKRKETDAL
ncbi:MAG: GldG family protein [Treponema sp.]|nr:GldG family protein [Treponema sp.]